MILSPAQNTENSVKLISGNVFSVKSLFTALFDKLASLGGGRTFETLPLKCQSSNNWVFGAGDGGRKRKDPRLGLAKHPGRLLKCSESVCAV